MKSKIKLKYILLAIGVLCVVAGLILIFTTPLGSVLARKAETFQLLIDRQIGDAHRLEMTNAYGNNSAYHPSVINFKEKSLNKVIYYHGKVKAYENKRKTVKKSVNFIDGFRVFGYNKSVIDFKV
jgi:hypothetical protein